MNYFSSDEETDSGGFERYAEVGAENTPEVPPETPAPAAPAAAATDIDPLENPGWSLEGLDKPNLLDDPQPAGEEPPATSAEPIAQPGDVFADLQPYGGVEGAVGTLKVVDQLVSATPEGVTAFLQTMYDSAQPAYTQLVEQVIAYNPEYAIQQLQASGHLPNNLNPMTAPPPAQTHLEPEVLEAIPEHLRDTALKLPAEMQEDLNLMTDAVRNQTLAEKKELYDMRAFQQQQQEQQQRQAYEQAVRSGVEQRDQLLGQMETGHLKVLEKWQPWGPEAADQNRVLYESLMEGAMRTVLQDAKYAQMYQDFNNLITQAPLQALQGNKMAADAATRQARGLAAQFNAQYSRELQQRVKSLDQVFRGYRQSQTGQASAPVRREVPGSVISDGKKVSAIGPDGQATDEFLNSLAATIRTTQ